MQKLTLSTLLILFLISTVKINAQSAQKIIQRNDIVVLENKVSLSESDKILIEDYNFDSYRFMNLRKKIQLVNGPLIEILSIKEVQALGKSIEQSIVDTASGKSEVFKHESILLLNIGLGINYINNGG